ncbi:MAG: head decoration protein [Desulfovibrio sp.]|nr:head decoration protein [Desulfovibrio sp.]
MSKVRCETYTKGPAFSETVLCELDTRFSRETAKLAPSDNDLPFGLVLMRKANGQYGPLTETPAKEASEGQKATPAKLNGKASAILLTPLEKSTEVQDAVILRGYSIVNTARLAWDASVSNKQEALTALSDRGFVLQEIQEVENADA